MAPSVPGVCFPLLIAIGMLLISTAARRSSSSSVSFHTVVRTNKTAQQRRCSQRNYHLSNFQSPLLSFVGVPVRSWSNHQLSRNRLRTIGSSQQICRFATTSTKTSTSEDDVVINHAKAVQDMLYRIRQVNDIPGDIRKSLLPFVVDGTTVGKVRPRIANLLSSIENSSIFQIVPSPDTLHDPNMSSSSNNNILTLDPAAGTTTESRTAAVAKVTHALREQGHIPGWRDELYPIARGFYHCGGGDEQQQPFFSMERAAVPWIGAMQYGVHINGLVVTPTTTAADGSSSSSPSSTTTTPLLWMARRSKTKSKYPGMLDHIVAGGQPTGISLWDNCIKECWEEAGIPPELTQQCLLAAGAISYDTYEPDHDVISRAVLFCFDLHLPVDFVPKAVDGEVDEFFLWTIPQVMASMAPDYDDPIKPNCYNVIIDYLMRAGHISPDTPGYLDVLRELRSGECY